MQVQAGDQAAHGPAPHVAAPVREASRDTRAEPERFDSALARSRASSEPSAAERADGAAPRARGRAGRDGDAQRAAARAGTEAAAGPGESPPGHPRTDDTATATSATNPWSVANDGRVPVTAVDGADTAGEGTDPFQATKATGIAAATQDAGTAVDAAARDAGGLHGVVGSNGDDPIALAPDREEREADDAGADAGSGAVAVAAAAVGEGSITIAGTAPDGECAEESDCVKSGAAGTDGGGTTAPAGATVRAAPGARPEATRDADASGAEQAPSASRGRDGGAAARGEIESGRRSSGGDAKGDADGAGFAAKAETASGPESTAAARHSGSTQARLDVAADTLAEKVSVTTSGLAADASASLEGADAASAHGGKESGQAPALGGTPGGGQSTRMLLGAGNDAPQTGGRDSREPAPDSGGARTHASRVDQGEAAAPSDGTKAGPGVGASTHGHAARDGTGETGRPGTPVSTAHLERALAAGAERDIVGRLRHDGEMRLTLQPHGLGELEVRVAVRDGGVHASVATANDDARQLLTTQRGDLETALERYNLRLDSFNVDVGGRDGRPAFERETQGALGAAWAGLPSAGENPERARDGVAPLSGLHGGRLSIRA